MLTRHAHPTGKSWSCSECSASLTEAAICTDCNAVLCPVCADRGWHAYPTLRDANGGRKRCQPSDERPTEPAPRPEPRIWPIGQVPMPADLVAFRAA